MTGSVVFRDDLPFLLMAAALIAAALFLLILGKWF